MEQRTDIKSLFESLVISSVEYQFKIKEMELALTPLIHFPFVIKHKESHGFVVVHYISKDYQPLYKCIVIINHHEELTEEAFISIKI